MRSIFVAVLFLSVGWSSAGHCQQSYESCADISDTALRLDCFDRAARDAKTPAVTSDQNKTADTKEMTQSRKPDEYKLVDADDMFVSPKKYRGKPVELRDVQCFYADKDDYRCLTTGGSVVMIESPMVMPESAKDVLENDCGSIKSVSTPACRRTIRFVPMDSEESQVNAFTKKMSFVSMSMELVSKQR